MLLQLPHRLTERAVAVDMQGQPIPPPISRAEIVGVALFCVVTVAVVVVAMLALVAVADALRWTCPTDCAAGD